MQNKNVLIVEDDDSIRNIVKLALELEGYEVQTAANGQEGLEILSHTRRPDLILLDLMMPVMDGWTFAEELSKDSQNSKIPVVVMTAYAEKTKDLKRASYVIKKPVNLDVLLDTVKKYSNGGGPF